MVWVTLFFCFILWTIWSPYAKRYFCFREWGGDRDVKERKLGGGWAGNLTVIDIKLIFGNPTLHSTCFLLIWRGVWVRNLDGGWAGNPAAMRPGLWADGGEGRLGKKSFILYWDSIARSQRYPLLSRNSCSSICKMIYVFSTMRMVNRMLAGRIVVWCKWLKCILLHHRTCKISLGFFASHGLGAHVFSTECTRLVGNFA